MANWDDLLFTPGGTDYDEKYVELVDRSEALRTALDAETSTTNVIGEVTIGPVSAGSTGFSSFDGGSIASWWKANIIAVAEFDSLEAALSAEVKIFWRPSEGEYFGGITVMCPMSKTDLSTTFIDSSDNTPFESYTYSIPVWFKNNSSVTATVTVKYLFFGEV